MWVSNLSQIKCKHLKVIKIAILSNTLTFQVKEAYVDDACKALNWNEEICGSGKKANSV